MALKFKFKSKDEIPAEHAAFYVERDGAFVLDTEGAVDKSKVDEFRGNQFLRRVFEFQGHDVHRSTERETINVLSWANVNGRNAQKS